MSNICITHFHKLTVGSTFKLKVDLLFVKMSYMKVTYSKLPITMLIK